MDGVAVPTDTIWKLEPHTGAKHRILGRYLDAWFPILGKFNRKPNPNLSENKENKVIGFSSCFKINPDYPDWLM
jgi:hypothetical protein